MSACMFCCLSLCAVVRDERSFECSSTAGVGKVRPVGQIRPASSVHPARGGSSVLTLNSARKTYRTMSDCFHAERDLVAH